MIKLTPRDQKYIAMLASGKTPAQIRKAAGLTSDSFKTAMYRIRRKAGVKTNTQLVIAFLTNQLQ